MGAPGASGEATRSGPRWARDRPTARALWALGLGTAGAFVILALIDARLRDTGGPGIVPFELAFTEERAREILADWGSDGRADAVLSLWLDYAFLMLYAAFFSVAAMAVRDALGWRRLSVVVVLPVAAAACDALENGCLLLAIGQDGAQPWPLMAGVFATAKFVLLTPAQLYVLAGFVVWLSRRRRR